MADYESRFERCQALVACLLEPIRDAQAKSNCDLSALLPDGYHCEERIAVGDDFEVWSAWHAERDQDVAVMLLHESGRVTSSEIAEQLLEDQARQRQPIDRGGAGYRSYLVYPEQLGPRLGRRRSKLQITTTCALGAVACLLLAMVGAWPAATPGIVNEGGEAETRHAVEALRGSTVSIDYDPDTDVVAWSNLAGEVWVRVGDEDTKLHTIAGGHTNSLDLSPGGDRVLIVDNAGHVHVLTFDGVRLVLPLKTTSKAWFAGDGRRVFHVDRDARTVTLTDLDSGRELRRWPAEGVVCRSMSDPDYFAVVGADALMVHQPGGSIELDPIKMACSFDVDTDQGVYAFGTRDAELVVEHEGRRQVSRLSHQTNVSRVMIQDERVYFSCVGGLYVVRVGEPGRITAMNDSTVSRQVVQSLHWDHQLGQLVASSTLGVHGWSGPSH